jgi:hypothetical protein
MRKLWLSMAIAAPFALLPHLASAKGCLKGAAVGGVVGHVAGHHAVAGAAVGCIIGHHRVKIRDKEAPSGAGQSQTTPNSATNATPNRSEVAVR